MRALFRDRQEAGERLVPLLAALRLEHPVVFALLRGGIAVGAPIAAALSAPLVPFIVRKLGVPWYPELAFGALAEGESTPILNDDVIRSTHLSAKEIAAVVEREKAELTRREAFYLRGRARPDPRNRPAIIVDDGLATGASARAALRALRRRGAAPLILAVPVAPEESIRALAGECDRVVVANINPIPAGVGGCYEDFHQLEDEEVLAILAAAEKASTSTS